MNGRSAAPAAERPRWVGEEFRRVHRLDMQAGPTGVGNPEVTSRGVVVDVETTGLDRTNDTIIELAMRQFRYDDAGRITEVGRPFCWLQDPGRPLTEEIMKLTGLNDDLLEGQSIDKDVAARILLRADLVVAHNAAFDRPRVEDEIPAAVGQAWACSCIEVDWRGYGFDGRSLGYLLSQVGYYNGAHRASDDVDSTIALLAHDLAPGRTVLAELVERSSRDSWIVRATGAAFETKDLLKRRGFRWDPDGRLWWREVVDVAEEKAWLRSNVYVPGAGASAPGPECVKISNRHRWNPALQRKCTSPA